MSMDFTPKRLARLIAVQALYQASYGEDDLASILKRCAEEPQSFFNDEETEGETIVGKPDALLLSQITHGVIDKREELESMLAGALDEKFSSARMEKLLRTIIMAGAYELYHHADVAAGIIISDYVDVARAFFNAKEPGLVNAVLDKLSKTLRA